MEYSNQSHNLRIELDTKNCRLSPAQIEQIEKSLNPLREPVRKFPVSDLYITVDCHPTTHDYHVRVALVLTGRTLFTGDRDDNPLAPLSRCVRKLVGKLTAYRHDLAAKPEQSKAEEGTTQEVLPTQVPDGEEIQRAIDEADFAAFRQATMVYEEPVRKRAGRWIQRYPEAQAQLGETFQISDLVEEVFLNAFERYADRPNEVRLGKWLEDLIDPSMKTLLADPEGEQENIDAVRAWRELIAGREQGETD